MNWTVTPALESYYTVFPTYPYAFRIFKHTCIGLSFLKISYTRYNVTQFLRMIDIINVQLLHLQTALADIHLFPHALDCTSYNVPGYDLNFWLETAQIFYLMPKWYLVTV
jgi:hypothetical protein